MEQRVNEHITPVKTYLTIYAALIILLVVTVGVSFVNLGVLSLPTALAIAAIKTVLIILYFMHVKYSSKLTWVYVGAGFFWLILLFALALGDYITRTWLPSWY